MQRFAFGGAQFYGVYVRKVVIVGNIWAAAIASLRNFAEQVFAVARAMLYREQHTRGRARPFCKRASLGNSQ
jgi:hypothetical protein